MFFGYCCIWVKQVLNSHASPVPGEHLQMIYFYILNCFEGFLIWLLPILFWIWLTFIIQSGVLKPCLFIFFNQFCSAFTFLDKQLPANIYWNKIRFLTCLWALWYVRTNANDLINISDLIHKKISLLEGGNLWHIC